MLFEWDDNKRKRNIQERGVDFVLAAGIFLNPVLEKIDDRLDYGEKRILALGKVNDEYLVVVYTWRNKKRRIISAWKAGKHGRQKYENALLEHHQETH